VLGSHFQAKLYRFPNIRQRFFFILALGYAAGNCGTFGYNHARFIVF
jgi:hypothetical protein